MNQEKVSQEEAEVRIRVLYNDFLDESFKRKELLIPEHGFSALVEIPSARILFDTGQSFDILFRNMLNLDLKIEDINFVFLSHYHKDHYGGLFDFLKRNYNVTVFLTKDFPQDFKQRILNSGASVVEIKKLSTLFNNVATTGAMGTIIKEQSIIVMTSNGAVIITGCAHQGLLELITSVKILEDKIIAIVGGFHLFEKSEEEIRNIANSIRDLGVKKVIPLHCSGEIALKVFKEVFKDNFVISGLGGTIQF